MHPRQFVSNRRVPATILGFVIALLSLAALSCGTWSTRNAAPSLTVMEKVRTAGRIRASYLIYSPYFRKDPNTGKLSGIFYDVMEAIGKNAGLKIDWVEEVGYENIFSGLDSGRHDVFAGGLWPNSSRAQSGCFSTPVFFSLIKAWGRADDPRFTNNLGAINDPSVRVAMIDGAMEDIIAKTDFPRAQRVSLPQLSPFSQNLLNLTSKKADVTFAEPGIVKEFLATNPGTLRELAPQSPLRTFGNCLVLKKGEVDFKQFLDVAMMEVIYDGTVDRILRQYESEPGVFFRVARPYELLPSK
jgi:polar amino acid transport system substrate-binding protein